MDEFHNLQRIIEKKCNVYCISLTLSNNKRNTRIDILVLMLLQAIKNIENKKKFIHIIFFGIKKRIIKVLNESRIGIKIIMEKHLQLVCIRLICTYRHVLHRPYSMFAFALYTQRSLLVECQWPVQRLHLN